MKERAFFSQRPEQPNGIEVQFYKTSAEIGQSGCYDSFCYLEGECIPLREFFDRVGITEKDCRRAFKQP